MSTPVGETTDLDAVVADILGTTPKAADTPAPVAEPKPGTTPELSEAARAAAEFEAEHADGKVDDSDKTEEKQASARASELQKLIDSKGGDEAKFAAGIVEQWNSTAQLAKKVEELEQALAATKGKVEPEPEEVADPEPVVDLSEVTNGLSALEAEQNANQANMNALIAEGTALRADILRLEGELRRADEHDKVALEAKIAEKKADIREKKAEFKAIEVREREIVKERKQLALEKKQIEREAAEAKAIQREQAQEIEAYKREQRRIFSDSADAVAKELGINDTKRDYFKKVVAAQVAFTLRQNASSAPVDMAALTKELFTEHCKELGIVKDKDFVELSKEKLQAQKGNPPPVKPTSPASPGNSNTNKAWTADFVKMRAAKILGN